MCDESALIWLAALQRLLPVGDEVWTAAWGAKADAHLKDGRCFAVIPLSLTGSRIVQQAKPGHANIDRSS